MGGFWGYSRARVSARNPRSLGRCDRCGFIWNRDALSWQYYYRGPDLQNTNFLVCRDCLDVPNPQTRTIIIPPDPVPILNPRIENYTADITSYLSSEDGDHFITEDGDTFITEDTL